MGRNRYSLKFEFRRPTHWISRAVKADEISEPTQPLRLVDNPKTIEEAGTFVPTSSTLSLLILFRIAHDSYEEFFAFVSLEHFFVKEPV